jgi:hypothetical protein
MKKYELAYDNYKGAIVRAENLHTGNNEIVRDERYVEAEETESLEQQNKEMLEVLKDAEKHLLSYWNNDTDYGNSVYDSDKPVQNLILKLQSIITKAEEE